MRVDQDQAVLCADEFCLADLLNARLGPLQTMRRFHALCPLLFTHVVSEAVLESLGDCIAFVEHQFL